MTELAVKNEMIFVCDASDPVDGEGFRVEIDGYPALAIFKHDGRYFIIDDKCTHGNASLCDGEVDGCEVECPFHAGAFNFMTGEPTAAPCSIPAKTYRSKVVDGKIYMVI